VRRFPVKQLLEELLVINSTQVGVHEDVEEVCAVQVLDAIHCHLLAQVTVKQLFQRIRSLQHREQLYNDLESQVQVFIRDFCEHLRQECLANLARQRELARQVLTQLGKTECFDFVEFVTDQV
jgi:hypothetical protein